MKRFIILLLIAVCTPLLLARTWTDQQGRSFDGELIKQEDDRVLIRRTSDYRQFWLEISSLAEPDQAYLKAQLKEEAKEEMIQETNGKGFWVTDFKKGLRKLRKDQALVVLFPNKHPEEEYNSFVENIVKTPETRELLGEHLVLCIDPNYKYHLNTGGNTGHWTTYPYLHLYLKEDSKYPIGSESLLVQAINQNVTYSEGMDMSKYMTARLPTEEEFSFYLRKIRTDALEHFGLLDNEPEIHTQYPPTQDGVEQFWETDPVKAFEMRAKGKHLLLIYAFKTDPKIFKNFIKEAVQTELVKKTLPKDSVLLIVSERSDFLDDRYAHAILRNSGQFLLQGMYKGDSWGVITFAPYSLKYHNSPSAIVRWINDQVRYFKRIDEDDFPER